MRSQAEKAESVLNAVIGGAIGAVWVAVPGLTHLMRFGITVLLLTAYVVAQKRVSAVYGVNTPDEKS